MDDLAFCGFRMYDEHHQPWGSVPEYFAQGVLMGKLSGGQRHLVCVREYLRARVRRLASVPASPRLAGCRRARVLEASDRKDGAGTRDSHR